MQRLVDTFAGGNIEAVVAENYVDHQARSETTSGRAGFGRMVAELRTAFPDLRIQIEDIIVDGDRAVARLRWQGTFLGDFWGKPPTGARIEVESIEIVRFVGGLAVEHWGLSQGWP